MLPWLIVARALVHNGCTTRVESFALGKPATTYRVSINEYFDDAFHRLPNLFSHGCFDFEQVQQTLTSIFKGNLGTANSDKRNAIMKHHLAALDGPLACERMVDIFEEMTDDLMKRPAPPLQQKLKSWMRATRRRVLKRYRTVISLMSPISERNYCDITIQASHWGRCVLGSRDSRRCLVTVRH